MSLHDNAIALAKNHGVFEDPTSQTLTVGTPTWDPTKAGASVMPRADAVLFSDTFEDGLLHGWMPTHFSGDLPQMPLSVMFEPDAGLLLATGSAYNPLTGQAAAYKRMTPPWKNGIVSFSIWYALLGETQAGQASAFGIEFDIQNESGSLRAHPVLQISNPGDGTSFSAQIADDTRTFRKIAQITNPFTGSTTDSTKGMLPGENENKGNQGYLRLSLLMGDLLTASADPSTCHYYEAAVGRTRLDLRATQTNNPGRGKQSTQGGSLIGSFNGEANAGITLSQSSTATGSAQLLVTKTLMTFHPLDSNGKGWLK